MYISSNRFSSFKSFNSFSSNSFLYVPMDFQHELMDSSNIKSIPEIHAMYEELRYKQLKENVMQFVKKELDLSFQQELNNIELRFYE